MYFSICKTALILPAIIAMFNNEVFVTAPYLNLKNVHRVWFVANVWPQHQLQLFAFK